MYRVEMLQASQRVDHAYSRGRAVLVSPPLLSLLLPHQHSTTDRIPLGSSITAPFILVVAFTFYVQVF